jgi:L-seryl-tRNA(Ser) seleniumtransferase
VQLRGEDILELAQERAAGGSSGLRLVPYEATAAIAMLLLRDHGLFTVHFAGLPPGTSALLLKFIPPDVLERVGGPAAIADAVDHSLSSLAGLLDGPADELRRLLFGTAT